MHQLIGKTLLLQMTKVTFTQFCKELARVHGTHQHSKPSSKVVSVSTVESKLGDEAALSKAKQKCKAKISVHRVPRFGICIVSWMQLLQRILKLVNSLNQKHCILW